MPFNSVAYLFFWPLVFLLHHYWRGTSRWVLLLGVSLVFYAALRVPHLLVFIIVAAAMSYGAGIQISRCGDESKRNHWLWFAVLGQILILVIAKYLPFLSTNLNFLGKVLGVHGQVPVFHPIVSIGVSFFIFQSIAYLFDVHLERQPEERHFGLFLLSLAFFPKLLQGPIERSRELIEQLRSPYSFKYENVRSGIALFAFGIFKKVVFADRLALFANEAFDHMHDYSGVSLMIGVYAYAFQIYLDFSAYTDMALGSARTLNIRLTPNFNRPYLATSVAEFWRRWHITFSRWILDYVFRPLQMLWRGWGIAGTVTALSVTFLISGIWHGASWNFIVWGLLHGVFLSAGVGWKGYQKKLYARLGIAKSRGLKALQVLVTFHLVCFAWIFFRTPTLAGALYYATHLFARRTAELSRQDYVGKILLLNQSWRDAAVLLVGGAIIVGVRVMFAANPREDIGERIGKLPLLVRWAFYLTFAMAAIVFGVFTNPPFIYYRF
jgi:alginate O-acetyltransferase complex protein AlgI